MSAALPIPPPELASRIGGALEDYEVIGSMHRSLIESALPDDWSYEGRTVLDFGCGTGRTMAALNDQSAHAEIWGCDIHVESIDWAQQNLSPPFHFFSCTEVPPLDQPDAKFDLIYAMSVFSHITDLWSAWLVELHRIMKPGGLAVITVLGPAMVESVIGREWDERTGMAVVNLQKNWDVGGPDVLLGDWWLRLHWGRAFDVLDIVKPGNTHNFVLLRKRGDVEVTPSDLEALDPNDRRELEAIAYNLEVVKDQLKQAGDDGRELARAKEDLQVRLDAAEQRLRELEQAGHSSDDSAGLLRRAVRAARR